MDRVCRCQDRLHRAGQSLGEWLHRELQRAPSRRAARRRNLLLTPRGPNRHRELAAPLQHDQAARLTWIQATGTGGIRARLRRVAGCAIPSGSAGHAGETANLKLTFHLDHSEGADQLEVRECAWCKKRFAPIRIDARFCSRPCLEKYFIEEKRQAVALWREMQRSQKFFASSTTVDGSNNEIQSIRRTG